MEVKFSEEDIKEYREVFDLFDKNKDDFITLDELKNVMKSLGNKPTDKEISRMIEEIDADGDGRINFPEFLNLMAARMKKTSKNVPNDLLATFRIFDKNGDGFITHSELKQAMEEQECFMSDNEVDEMIQAADTDGDGKVDYNEFLDMMKKTKK